MLYPFPSPSLSQAWSSIVYSLIPNVKVLASHLQNFCSICEADEVVLFERATFLVISHSTLKEHPDVHRFEKISNIIKQFKLSCTYVPHNPRPPTPTHPHPPTHPLPTHAHAHPPPPTHPTHPPVR